MRKIDRSKKLLYGFMAGVVLTIYGTVSEMDYRDEVEFEQYIAELNARKLLNEKYPEDKRPAYIITPDFVGKPSGKFYETEFAKLRKKFQR